LSQLLKIIATDEPFYAMINEPQGHVVIAEANAASICDLDLKSFGAERADTSSFCEEWTRVE
jgi:hypothetical protein